MSTQVTTLLISWSQGSESALKELTPLIYAELRRLADHYLRRERPGHTLQPTALVNEAYIRLVRQDLPDWKSRAHFFGVAAQIMRQILVDHARRFRAAKRGGGGERVPLEEAVLYTDARATEFLALDQALTALAELDPRKARAVELRYFGGMSLEEIARAIEVSVPTVVRELRFAEAWLLKQLTEACQVS
jgi:RNA polymerase sigma-70 factor, ECF subfamily